MTQDQGAAGSSLTGVTALWSLSRTHLTELRLLMGRTESNQASKQSVEHSILQNEKMIVLKKDGLNLQLACGIFNDIKTVMKIFVLEYMIIYLIFPTWTELLISPVVKIFRD